jgi:hypothetical protein
MTFPWIPVLAMLLSVLQGRLMVQMFWCVDVALASSLSDAPAGPTLWALQYRTNSGACADWIIKAVNLWPWAVSGSGAFVDASMAPSLSVSLIYLTELLRRESMSTSLIIRSGLWTMVKSNQSMNNFHLWAWWVRSSLVLRKLMSPKQSHIHVNYLPNR